MKLPFCCELPGGQPALLIELHTDGSGIAYVNCKQTLLDRETIAMLEPSKPYHERIKEEVQQHRWKREDARHRLSTQSINGVIRTLLKKSPGFIRCAVKNAGGSEELAAQLEAEIWDTEQRVTFKLGEDRTNKRRVLPTERADQRCAARMARDAAIEKRDRREQIANLERCAEIGSTPEQQKARPSRRRARLNQRIDQQIALALSQSKSLAIAGAASEPQAV